MGGGTLPKVRDESGEPLEGPRWVVGPFRRSDTCRGTLGEVWDGLGDAREVRDCGLAEVDCRGGPRRVGERSGRSRTG